jgi:hypothetical protein
MAGIRVERASPADSSLVHSHLIMSQCSPCAAPPFLPAHSGVCCPPLFGFAYGRKHISMIRYGMSDPKKDIQIRCHYGWHPSRTGFSDRFIDSTETRMVSRCTPRATPPFLSQFCAHLIKESCAVKIVQRHALCMGQSKPVRQLRFWVYFFSLYLAERKNITVPSRLARQEIGGYTEPSPKIERK